MSRIETAVLIQGTQKQGLIHWNQLLSQYPNAQSLIGETQRLLTDRAIDVDLMNYMTAPERSIFSSTTQIFAEQVLTFLYTWHFWHTKFKPSLEAQDMPARPAFLGHSYGLWLAFALNQGNFSAALEQIILPRAIHTSKVPGSTILFSSNENRAEEPIDLVAIQGLCQLAKEAWISVVNNPQRQVAVAGTEAGVKRVIAGIGALELNLQAREFPLGVAWHTPLLMETAATIANDLPPAKSFAKNVTIPVLYLDRRGRLRATTSSKRILGLMMRELTEPFLFWDMARQLGSRNLVEINLQSRKFLTGFVQQATPTKRNHAPSKQKAGALALATPL